MLNNKNTLYDTKPLRMGTDVVDLWVGTALTSLEATLAAAHDSMELPEYTLALRRFLRRLLKLPIWAVDSVRGVTVPMGDGREMTIHDLLSMPRDKLHAALDLILEYDGDLERFERRD